MQKSEVVTKEDNASLMLTKSIPIKLLKPSRYQVRDTAFFNKENLENLAASIRSIGLLEHPKVRVSPEDPEYFEIISGHRRIHAVSEILGWTEIECEISECPDELRTVQLCLDENIQRHNLSSYEEGVAFLLVEKMFGLSQEQIAEKFHQSRATVQIKRQLAVSANHYLKYAEPSYASAFLRHVTLGHMEVLPKLDPNNVKHAMKMISRGATVRHLERFANLFGKNDERDPKTPPERYSELSHINTETSAETNEYNLIDSEGQVLGTLNQLIEESPDKLKARLREIRKALRKILRLNKSLTDVNSKRGDGVKTICCPKCGAIVSDS